MIGIAVDRTADAARPWLEEAGATFPNLLDPGHRTVQILGLTNVPAIVWVDEAGRVVRPNTYVFGTDTFIDFTGMESEPHLDAVRHWVRTGEVVLEPGVGGEVKPLDPDKIDANLHFGIGADLLEAGDEDGAAAHFDRAAELAPMDFVITRSQLPLLGDDPFGERFFALHDQWQKAGYPRNGLTAKRGRS